jgi:hypothetical protein
MKDSTLHSWVASGGSEEEFEQEWPTLRREMLRQRTLEREESARAAGGLARGAF